MKLGELVRIRTGRLDANQAVENGRYPFFTCAAEPLRIDAWQYDCECVLVAGNCNPYVSYYNGKFNAYQRVYIIEVEAVDRLCAKYLYYFLKLYMKRSTDRQHGAIEKFFHLSDFTDIEVNFPSVEEQRLVADSLWAIDRKIALNRKRVATLEAMAKEIYDYWFVQFDFPDAHGRPYKSSGGAMVYNPDLKREIPKGWEVKPLAEAVKELNSGEWGTDACSEISSVAVHCLRGADMEDQSNLPARYISERKTDKLLSVGDIVIEMSGGSPTQATGRSCYVSQGLLDAYNGKLTCTNFCNSLKLKEMDETATSFLYGACFIRRG